MKTVGSNALKTVMSVVDLSGTNDDAARELAEAAEGLLHGMSSHKHEDGYYTLGETGHFQHVAQKVKKFRSCR